MFGLSDILQHQSLGCERMPSGHARLGICGQMRQKDVRVSPPGEVHAVRCLGVWGGLP